MNKIIGLTIAYLVALAPMHAAMSNDIANGVAAYNKGWYSTALYYLTLAEPQYPHNAFIHYYRANTLVRLMRVPEAMTEYAEAADLDPNGVTGNYAREALKTACDLNSNGSNTPQHALVQEGNALGNSFLQSAKARESNRLEFGQRQYNHIRQTEQIGVQRMQNTGFNIDGAWIQCYTPDNIAAYKQQEEQKEDHALETAHDDAEAISSRAYNRANAIESSASALAQQLADPQSNDGSILNPVGTNLYVRNYILTP